MEYYTSLWHWRQSFFSNQQSFIFICSAVIVFSSYLK